MAENSPFSLAIHGDWLQSATTKTRPHIYDQIHHIHQNHQNQSIWLKLIMTEFAVTSCAPPSFLAVPIVYGETAIYFMRAFWSFWNTLPDRSIFDTLRLQIPSSILGIYNHHIYIICFKSLRVNSWTFFS